MIDKQTARDLRQLGKLQALVEAAIEVRNGRYSVNGKLSREDRTLFDRFNMAVDAWQFGEVE